MRTKDLGLLLLLACLGLGCRYPKACIERPFPGLRDTIERTSTNGSSVRMLIVHGMTSHKPGYSSNFSYGLAKQLNLGPHVRSLEPLLLEGLTNGFLGRASFTNGNQLLQTYELTWTPATKHQKRNAFALDEGLSDRRALLNRRFKRMLVNDGFGDAIMYVGEPKRRMQNAVTNALGRIIDDGFKPTDHFVIITHSLGSKMTFDSMDVMAGANNLKPSGKAQAVQDLAAQTSYPGAITAVGRSFRYK